MLHHSPCGSDQVISIDARSRLRIFLVRTPIARVDQLPVSLVLLRVHDVVAVKTGNTTQNFEQRKNHREDVCTATSSIPLFMQRLQRTPKRGASSGSAVIMTSMCWNMPSPSWQSAIESSPAAIHFGGANVCINTAGLTAVAPHAVHLRVEHHLSYGATHVYEVCGSKIAARRDGQSKYSSCCSGYSPFAAEPHSVRH